MIALLLTLAAAAQDGDMVDRVAAIVNDIPIALSEVYDVGGEYIRTRCQAGPTYDGCIREGELEVLDSLIKWQLIKQELDVLEMRVTGEDVDRAIDTVIRDNGFGDRQELREYVESTGARWESYREQLKDSIRTDRFRGAVLAPQVVVTEDESRDLYQRTKRRMDSGEQEATLAAFGVVIPVDADEAERAARTVAVEDVVRQINAGKLTWEEAVADYDSANLAAVVADRVYTRGQLQADIDALAFSAPIGLVNPPVIVGSVLFVVKVLTRDAAADELQSFEEVREQLRGQLFQQKLQRLEEEWYQRARREAAVRVLLEAG